MGERATERAIRYVIQVERGPALWVPSNTLKTGHKKSLLMQHQAKVHMRMYHLARSRHSFQTSQACEKFSNNTVHAVQTHTHSDVHAMPRIPVKFFLLNDI